MKKFPSQALKGWPDLWRYPDLMVALATGVEDIDSSSAVLTLARGIANERTPEDVLRSLLEARHFRTVRFLLGMPSFRDQLGDNYFRLEAEAADCIERIHFELVARDFELRARENRLGLTVTLRGDEIQHVIQEDALRADRLLSAWSSELDKEEQLKRVELEHRLQEKLEGTLVGQFQSWNDAIRRLINTNRFEMAEKLLAEETRAQPDYDDPEAIPRRPRWHYTFPVTSAIRKIRAQEPPPDVGFQERWTPVKDDRAAHQLLDCLEELSSQQDLLSLECVSRFGCVLDEFLSGHPGGSREAIEVDGGYYTFVYEVADHHVLRLDVGGQGVPVWIPRMPDHSAPENLMQQGTVLAFHPERAPVGRAGLIGFDARLLFPLLGQTSYRKINFLRGLMRRISVKDVIPNDLDLDLISTPAGESSWTYAAWFLDYLGLQVDSPATLDLICFYGDRTDILVLLLSKLVASIEERNTLIRSSDVHRLWLTPNFRDAVTERLLKPIKSSWQTGAVLGCIFFLAGSGEPPTVSDLNSWLSEAWDFSDQMAIRKALDLLEDAKFIELDSDGFVRLPQTGITQLVRAAIGNSEVFVQTAIAGRS
jgi:hypothetical protein